MWWPLLSLHRHRDSVFHTPATRINNSSPFCELEPLSAHSPSSIPPGQAPVKLWSIICCLWQSWGSTVLRGIRAQLLSDHHRVSVRSTNFPSRFSRYFTRISLISDCFHPRQGWKSPSHCQMFAANPVLTVSQGLQYCISAHQKASMTIWLGQFKTLHTPDSNRFKK